jgi:hypothetical protein
VTFIPPRGLPFESVTFPVTAPVDGPSGEEDVPASFLQAARLNKKKRLISIRILMFYAKLSVNDRAA